jgi:hypothetical protein
MCRFLMAGLSGPKHGLTRCSIPAGQNLDRHPDYILAAYMASGT